MAVVPESALAHVIATTDLRFLGQKYEGKVRDCYRSGDGRMWMVATDRLSCFDRVVTTVPFKGQVLSQLARYWFERLGQIMPNHVLAYPHPNVLEVAECRMLPVEVVVRGYLAGSAWRDYEAGRPICGITLPKGLKNYARLETPIITPTTKAEVGAHDQPISAAEIVQRGIVKKELWAEIETRALQLFALGTKILAEKGLLLVDTKYEFGLRDGKLCLADEVHTLDSSRMWEARDYEERLARNEPPKMLDKEPARQWLAAKGFRGEGPMPEIPDAQRLAFASHYISAFERITGTVFRRESAPIEKALRRHG